MRGNDPCEPETRCLEKRTVLGLGAFAAARYSEHLQIDHDRATIVFGSLGQKALDQKQSALRHERLAAVGEDG